MKNKQRGFIIPQIIMTVLTLMSLILGSQTLTSEQKIIINSQLLTIIQTNMPKEESTPISIPESDKTQDTLSVPITVESSPTSQESTSSIQVQKECKCGLIAELSPTNPYSQTYKVGDKNIFLSIRISSIGNTDATPLKQVIITRQGGNDEVFGNVYLSNNATLLQTTKFVDGKAIFNLDNFTVYDASMPDLRVSADIEQISSESISFSLMDTSDITAISTCPNIDSKGMITFKDGSIVGQGMTIE